MMSADGYHYFSNTALQIPHMSNFEHLLSLLRQLDRSDLKMLKRSLDVHNEAHANKQTEFLELLIANLDLQEHALMQKLKKKRFDATQSKYLIRCLTARIYDHWLMDATINRKDNYSEATKATILVKKRILQIQILWGKQQLQKLSALLVQTEKLAEEFELLDELIELLRIRQEFSGLRQGLKLYNELESQIQKATQLSALLKRSKYMLNHCMLCQGNAPSEQIPLKDIASLVQENFSAMASTICKRLQYYNCLLQLELCQSQTDHTAAKAICNELESLAIANPFLISIVQLGGIYLQQAYHSLKDSEVEICESYLAKANPLIRHSEMNLAVADELAFFCAFHSGNWMAADELLQRIMKIPADHLPVDLEGRRHYYAAWMHFVKGEYALANKVLLSIPRFKPEHADWDTGQRFLKIMTFAELGDLDSMGQEIDALRKHLFKEQKKSNPTKRWNLLFSLVRMLNRTESDFRKVVLENEAIIQQLVSGDAEYRWAPTGPELVPVYVWLFQKSTASSKKKDVRKLGARDWIKPPMQFARMGMPQI
jgi:hypothetical protein